MGFFSGLSNVASGNFLLDPDKGDNSFFLDPFDITGQQAASAGDKANKAQQESIRRAIEIIRAQGQTNDDLFGTAQGDINQAQGLFDPFINAGGQGLQGLQQGATAGGFGQRLNEIIGGDAFGGLLEERNRNSLNQLGSVGLSRSGVNQQAGEDIPTELALQLENILSGRQSNLANLGFEGARGSSALSGISAGLTQSQAQSGTNLSQDIASLIGTGGAASANNIVNSQQAQTQGAQGIGSIIASFFSDPRLKENIVKLGKIGPLDFVEWDWKEEFEGTVVMDSPNRGFLSTQVREHFPEYVGHFGGYDIIDYPALVKRLS
jgi:hypothetical protein